MSTGHRRVSRHRRVVLAAANRAIDAAGFVVRTAGDDTELVRHGVVPAAADSAPEPECLVGNRSIQTAAIPAAASDHAGVTNRQVVCTTGNGGKLAVRNATAATAYGRSLTAGRVEVATTHRRIAPHKNVAVIVSSLVAKTAADRAVFI